MLYEEITRKILEACFEVSNELGIGYLESVYEKALMVALSQKRPESPTSDSVRGQI